jgi:hypothetical protein
MRKTILVLILTFTPLLSYSAQKYPEVCLTHGECQDAGSVVSAPACFVVKTGNDYMGRVTCVLRCYQVLQGDYCRKPKDEIYGFCSKEEFQTPIFDPSNPDCSNAIDPI